MNTAELCAQGREWLAAGAAAEAARCFRAAIEQEFDHTEAHHGLLRALCATGRARQAVDVGLALITLAPRDPRSHAALSRALAEAGLPAESERAVQRARELAGADPAAFEEQR